MLARRSQQTSMFSVPRRLSRPAQALLAGRLDAARRSYVTRRVPPTVMSTLLPPRENPAPGDLVLVRVLTVGGIRQAESAAGTLAELTAGNEIVACYDDVRPNVEGRYELSNAAGVVSPASRRFHEATTVALLGAIGDANGSALNIADWATPPAVGRDIRLPVVAVIGERQLPGESCRAADMVRGLAAAGFRVGAANITSVPGCWKVRMMHNAGACTALDITDAGYVTTRGQGAGVIESIFLGLVGGVCLSGAEIVVLEIDKDIFDHDAATLISLSSFQDHVTTVVLEGRAGTGAELERESLRALGFDVTLVDEPGHRPRYRRLV